MTQATFVERRSAAWNQLDALLARAGRGVRRMQAEDVAAIGVLYRAVTSDLAYATGRGYDARLIAYLNRLVARAHAYVYGGAATSGWQRVARFYTQTFPQEFRRSFAYIAICAAITIVSAIVAYVLVRTHPATAYALLPDQLIPAQIKKSLHDSNFAFDPSTSPTVASEIITNNVRVAIIAFAGCVTLGLLTLYIIFFNGLMLGGVGALFTNAGFGADFWATIAPHGVIELTAIQIAGAAGLMISAGILAPGRLRRRDAIAAAARRAGILIAGVASMLLVAGTIEGFYSPLRLPASDRIAVGTATAVLLAVYFTFAGRAVSRSS
ncbi:MAG TPA: stage II sporulation protein M [Candidatus Acidoferrales bacterium]|nr:stage II sporulation protein M [Candidatus Acidoferrales bacterium]